MFGCYLKILYRSREKLDQAARGFGTGRYDMARLSELEWEKRRREALVLRHEADIVIERLERRSEGMG